MLPLDMRWCNYLISLLIYINFPLLSGSKKPWMSSLNSLIVLFMLRWLSCIRRIYLIWGIIHSLRILFVNLKCSLVTLSLTMEYASLTCFLVNLESLYFYSLEKWLMFYDKSGLDRDRGPVFLSPFLWHYW